MHPIKTSVLLLGLISFVHPALAISPTKTFHCPAPEHITWTPEMRKDTRAHGLMGHAAIEEQEWESAFLEGLQGSPPVRVSSQQAPFLHFYQHMNDPSRSYYTFGCSFDAPKFIMHTIIAGYSACVLNQDEGSVTCMNP
jgi:hypothetical protein